MCVCNANKAAYEMIITNKDGELLCDLYFKSISTVCRFIESDVNTDLINLGLFRIKDNQSIDIELLMSIWKLDFMEED